MNNSLALFQLLTAQDGVGENGADATVGVLGQRPESKREEYQQHRHQPRTAHEHVREEERKERDALHPSRHHRRHRLYNSSSDKQRKVTFLGRRSVWVRNNWKRLHYEIVGRMAFTFSSTDPPKGVVLYQTKQHSVENSHS